LQDAGAGGDPTSTCTPHAPAPTAMQGMRLRPGRRATAHAAGVRCSGSNGGRAQEGSRCGRAHIFQGARLPSPDLKQSAVGLRGPGAPVSRSPPKSACPCERPPEALPQPNPPAQKQAGDEHHAQPARGRKHAAVCRTCSLPAPFKRGVQALQSGDCAGWGGRRSCRPALSAGGSGRHLLVARGRLGGGCLVVAVAVQVHEQVRGARLAQAPPARPGSPLRVAHSARGGPADACRRTAREPCVVTLLAQQGRPASQAPGLERSGLCRSLPAPEGGRTSGGKVACRPERYVYAAPAKSSNSAACRCGLRGVCRACPAQVFDHKAAGRSVQAPRTAVRQCAQADPQERSPLGRLSQLLRPSRPPRPCRPPCILHRLSLDTPA